MIPAGSRDFLILMHIRELLGRVNLRGFPVKFDLDAQQADDGIHLKLRYEWPDRENPSVNVTINLVASEALKETDDMSVLRAVRNLMGFVFLHELDEGFFYAGPGGEYNRIFEPHLLGTSSATVCLCPEYPCEHLGVG